jgi:phospholipase D1/2
MDSHDAPIPVKAGGARSFLPAIAIEHAAAKPSGLRTEVGSEYQSPTSPLSGSGSGIEARDYMNGGLPHEAAHLSFPSILTNAQTSPKLQSTLKKPVEPSPPSQNATAASNGTSTPPGRRSVQFARTEGGGDSFGHTRQESYGVEDGDTPSRDRRAVSLISKLKALTLSGGLQTHSRAQSVASVGEGSASAPQTPTVERSGRRVPQTLAEEDSDADADAEETADEDTAAEAAKTRRKRRFRRPHARENSSQTAPTTPNARTSGFNDSPATGLRRFNDMMRQSTLSDGIEYERGGMSEGEGGDRLRKQSAWRRGSSWVNSGLRSQGHTGNHDQEGGEGVAGLSISRRPSNFRRLTGFGGGSDGEAQSPRRPFLGGERASTFGAARWRMLKHGLKMLGQRKEEHKIDYLKSAELMAELRAGAPAALMLASMIQRDEHGNKRIPVLLEQLKLQITDSQNDEKQESERHLVFRIELEYGSGTNRMKWVIQRTLRDFANLHLRYRLQASSDKYIQLRSDVDSRPKQPRFPKSAFPYLRAVRGLGESEDDDADTIRVEDTVGEATHSEGERPGKKSKKIRPSQTHIRRRSSLIGTDPDASGGDAFAARQAAKAYNERQRRRLEQYLQEMIRWLIFRADSNRLCKFLELSALGVRLAAEGGYHGKEGFLVIQTSNALDFRKVLTPKAIFARHSPKWFLVRQNYIVCVDSPENMHVYDVFLLDPKFEIETKRRKTKDTPAKEIAYSAGVVARHPQHHRLKLHNSERRIKLLAKNERQLRQFEASIQHMMSTSKWAEANRFGSFAPVRTGVHAQWLVDGRDYMWNVSRAINQAKDVIYIHDWWLSPQLYMRRPAAISQKWRLDRLLRKKAREGVKVFIIIYRNVEAAVPIDSEFTKFSMLDLHPNVFVQRSPNQFKKNQFFFAHHEKICIVDHSVAFVGGIDLCFGRWDTPQHSVTDDKPTGFEHSDEPKDADHCQLWPGKDYSNPRVQDFYQLSEPYAEMYDRSKTPRMPWHDVSMQVVGQPARDLTRHFIQRWNYVLRGRKPTRPTPFLLPPPDYVPADLEALGMDGTCEVQILRSASPWSLGLEDVECSIQTAYCKMIEESDHFVYMENQFFITSCETMNVKIENHIGDALVERAIRAFKNNESWRCIICIPLMPGFQNTVDAADGTSVRLIMQCQFRSICRGETSIFGRLRAEGIDPEDYITFYSLRTWGKIGPNKMLVTEQLYIHAKVIIVDDRIALIGSANINERSMVGNRDSECAAVVRDTDMIWSTMDGEPYLVGRFAHTLRMRLMREHLGLDVDEVMEEDRRAELDREEEEYEADMDRMYDHDSDVDEETRAAYEARTKRRQSSQAEYVNREENSRSFNHDIDVTQSENPNLKSDKHHITSDRRVTNNLNHAAEVDGEGYDQWKAAEKSGLSRGRDSVVVDGAREVLVAGIAAEGKGSVESPQKPHVRLILPQKSSNEGDALSNVGLPPTPHLPRRTTEQLGLPQLSQLPALPIIDDTDIGGPPVQKDSSGKSKEFMNPAAAEIKSADITKDCMRDPLNDSFFEDIWRTVAENNTKIFRRVFRCNPDNEVTNWHEYTEFQAYAERFAQAQSGVKSQEREEQENKGKSGPPGAGLAPGAAVLGQNMSAMAEKVKRPDTEKALGKVSDWAEKAETQNQAHKDSGEANGNANGSTIDEKVALRKQATAEVASPVLPGGTQQLPPLNGNSTSSTIHTTDTITAQRIAFSAPNTEKVEASATVPITTTSTNNNTNGGSKRRRRATTKSRFSAADDLMPRADAEALLSMIQGNLVIFPTEWLKAEEHNSNWLYQVDMVAPLQI